jgi:hypothetical protein
MTNNEMPNKAFNPDADYTLVGFSTGDYPRWLRQRYAWINIMIGISVRMPCRVCRERINHVRRLLLVLLIMISYYI